MVVNEAVDMFVDTVNAGNIYECTNFHVMPPPLILCPVKAHARLWFTRSTIVYRIGIVPIDFICPVYHLTILNDLARADYVPANLFLLKQAFKSNELALFFFHMDLKLYSSFKSLVL